MMRRIPSNVQDQARAATDTLLWNDARPHVACGISFGGSEPNVATGALPASRRLQLLRAWPKQVEAIRTIQLQMSGECPGNEHDRKLVREER